MSQSQPITFDPNFLPFDASLSRHVLRQHLTHVNNVFWIGQNFKEIVPNSYAAAVASDPTTTERFKNQNAWSDCFVDFEIWTRQSAVIFAASMLEVYIVSAALSVFHATPELLDRSVLGVDSVTRLKSPPTTMKQFGKIAKERAESFTKGTWTDRLRRIEMTFGTVPAEVHSEVGTLQALQDLRNRIAHRYGHDRIDLRKTPWEPVKAINPNDASMKDYFKVVDVVSLQLDKHVFCPLIGGYEIINEYHTWRSNNELGASVGGHLKTEAFKRYIGNAFGRAPSKKYIDTMISYYENA